MENLQYLVRNQYILGLDTKIDEVKKHYKGEAKEFIAGCFNIKPTGNLKASEVMDILQKYYSQNNRKIGALKRKYGFTDIEEFLKEKNIFFIKPELLVQPNIDIIKAYSEFLKTFPEKVFSYKTSQITFYEYFCVAMQANKSVADQEKVVKWLISIIPKKMGHSKKTIIYNDYLYCKQDNLDYEELVKDTLAFMEFPYIYNRLILDKFLQHYKEYGTLDCSMSAKMSHLLFILTELGGKPLAKMFPGFEYTDAYYSFLTKKLLIYPYGKDSLRVYNEDVSGSIVVTRNQFQYLHKTGLLYSIRYVNEVPIVNSEIVYDILERNGIV